MPQWDCIVVQCTVAWLHVNDVSTEQMAPCYLARRPVTRLDGCGHWPQSCRLNSLRVAHDWLMGWHAAAEVAMQCVKQVDRSVVSWAVYLCSILVN